MCHGVPAYTPCSYVFEWGRRISPSDVTWIQIDATSRIEVLQRLGIPMSESQDWSRLPYERPVVLEGESADHPRKATYLYTKAETYALGQVRATQQQFWVVFDEAGVVQDFGFESDPSVQPDSSSVAIR